MKPRNTLIIVALFVLLWAFVLYDMNKPQTESGASTATPAQSIFRLDESNVKSIQVSDLRSPRQVQVSRTNDGWQIDLPTVNTADQDKVDTVLSSLTTLRATRIITNVTDFAQYGLVTANLEARLVMSDTTSYAITVGDMTLDKSGYYVVYTGDKSKIFIVSQSNIDDMKNWLDQPPYLPTPTPSVSMTIPVSTPSLTISPTPVITISPTETTPTVSLPHIVPTLFPIPTDTPKP